MIKQVVVDNTGGKVAGGPAQPVEVLTAAQVAGLPVEAKAQRVVQVTDADIAAGRAKVAGGRPRPVVLGATGVDDSGGPALLVYVVAGSLTSVIVSAPVNTSLPTISGTTELAATLTATTGTWSNSPTSYAYQWYRGGVAIGGATSSTYVLTSSDLGQTVTVTVTATNAGGSASATSAGTFVPNYLLLDHFTTTQGAPLTTPRTAEPGPGTLTIVDVNNVLSIATARLVINGTPSGPTDGFIGPSLVRQSGWALVWTTPSAPGGLGNGNSQFGWVSTNAITGTGVGSMSWQDAANIQIFPQPGASFGANVWSGLPGTVWEFAVVLRGTGVWYFTRQGAGNWTLSWVDSTGSASPVYPRLRLSANAYNVTLDDLRAVYFGSPFDSDYGFVTDRKAVSSAGDTITTTADCLVEDTFVAATGVTKELRIRYLDDNNCIVIRMDQTAGTIRVFERNAGVETEKTGGSTARVWSNGTTYRVVALAYGSNIKTYVNATQQNVTTSTFQQTQIGAKVDHSGTNFASWPRSVALPNF